MLKKLITYFLLLNFLNTVCFPEFQADLPDNSISGRVDNMLPDEIDSMVEFVAEYCLDLGDDFSESDLEDQSDNYKSRTIKDFLLPGTFVFGITRGFLIRERHVFSCLFPVNFFEIDSPPPQSGMV